MPPFPGETDNAIHRNIAHSSVHLQDKRLCITNKILSEKEDKRSKKTEFKAHVFIRKGKIRKCQQNKEELCQQNKEQQNITVSHEPSEEKFQ